MRTFPLVLAFVALAGSAGALELSLEENRTQKGSVGYVDMQRVFSESPDSALAKESFEQIVREAEERVNLKRAEILKLHQELDATKAEREKLSKEALTAPSAASAAGSAPLAPPTSSTAPAGALPLATLLSLSAPPAAPPAAPPTVAASTAAAATPAATGRGRRYRDDPNDITASTTPVTVALAPVATSTAAVAASTATVGAAASAATVAASTAAAAAPAVVNASTAAVAAHAVAASTAAVSAPAAAPATVSLSTASLTGTAAIAAHVLELDGKIIALQATILKKEEALVRERSETDKGLVSIEGRKTDQVLVKIYAAITAVARQEGVSIVVDRSTILYGQQGVDLTDKVLLYLRSPAQP